MGTCKTYRVVGVRSSGERVAVDEGLTIERANQVWILLACANAFPRVQIEPDRSIPNDVPAADDRICGQVVGCVNAVPARS